MDLLRLRILTKKSTFDFYKKQTSYDGLTIGRLLELKKHKFLLVAYYYYSKISFNEEVLQELGVTHIIDKPGRLSYLEGKDIIIQARKKIGLYPRKRSINTQEVSKRFYTGKHAWLTRSSKGDRQRFNRTNPSSWN